jgi:hypothetical protein
MAGDSDHGRSLGTALAVALVGALGLYSSATFQAKSATTSFRSMRPYQLIEQIGIE